MNTHKPILFDWRAAVVSSDLPPTTRHVLLTLALWMSPMGENCYPTTKQLASATGLTERTVCTHLDNAKELGWIGVKVHGFRGQKWRNHQYVPMVPEYHKALKEIQQLKDKGAEGDSAALSEGTETGSVPLNEATEPDDKKVLKEVQCNTPSNTPIPHSTSARARDSTSSISAIGDFFSADQIQATEGNDYSPKGVAEWKRFFMVMCNTPLAVMLRCLRDFEAWVEAGVTLGDAMLAIDIAKADGVEVSTPKYYIAKGLDLAKQRREGGKHEHRKGNGEPKSMHHGLDSKDYDADATPVSEIAFLTPD